MSTYCRPASCDHDSELDDCAVDSFVPIYKCGCIAERFPLSRIYRPPSIELVDLTSDDTIPLSPTVVWRIDDILADMELEVLPSATLIEDRMEISRLLSRPVVLQLKSRVTGFNLTEWVDAHDVLPVLINWVVILRRGYQPFDADFNPMYCVVCEHCAGMLCGADGLYDRIFESPVSGLTLEVDSAGQMIVDCEFHPKRYVAHRHGRLLGAKFAMRSAGMASLFCVRCNQPTFQAFPPTSDVRFDYHPSSYIERLYLSEQQQRINDFPQSVDALYH